MQMYVDDPHNANKYVIAWRYKDENDSVLILVDPQDRRTTWKNRNI